MKFFISAFLSGSGKKVLLLLLPIYVLYSNQSVIHKKMARCGCVVLLLFLVIFTEVNSQQGGGDPEDPNNPHRDPSKCEICKFVAIELQGMMEDTGKTREVLELGYRIDREQKKIPYKFSELRLIESMEGVCQRIMEYNIHAERKSSRRFAKGMSETFQTLHGLVNKGVKVELGIPYNMWDEPSAPVHTLRKYCDTIVEEHEDAIEAWFRGDQEKTLINYLCAERVLSREEAECLQEEWTGVEKVEHNTENKEENETSEDSADEEDGEGEEDPAKKKQADLDKQKVQKEIERQAKQQQNQEERGKEREREQERDRRKREREIERRKREREDKDGDRKMRREQDDKRKVQREIERQAEREKVMRERYGDDYYDKRMKDRERDRERERRRRRGGRDYEHDYDRYMDDELEDMRRGHHFDADEYVDRIMDRERREREDRMKRYRNEL
ncbi:uncharacterized protein [Amphiura filiformis]|uniref:uncharacterized protein n=1 Tax=Amphiura filiformis TaxID=82378 RepID=UPI003B2249B9